MSMTLNLITGLLARGRRFLALGRDRDAWRVLHTLSQLSKLPADIAEELQLLLATIQLSHDNHRRARRHLAAALLINPDNAQTHLMLAGAYADGEKASPKRADRHFRRSLELDPNQAQGRCEYAEFLIRESRRHSGLVQLRVAAGLTTDDTTILERIARQFWSLGRPGEAGTMLQAALFRHPHDSRYTQLWLDHQFRLVSARQQKVLRRARAAQQASERSILPFVPPDAGVSAGAARFIRRDQGSALSRPHLGFLKQRPDQKQA